MPGRTSRQELTRMDPAPPARTMACMDATVQCSSPKSPAFEATGNAGLFLKQGGFYGAARALPASSPTSSLRIRSLGSGLYLNPQLLLLIQ